MKQKQVWEQTREEFLADVFRMPPAVPHTKRRSKVEQQPITTLPLFAGPERERQTEMWRKK
jgi:hypothetical protein